MTLEKERFYDSFTLYVLDFLVSFMFFSLMVKGDPSEDYPCNKSLATDYLNAKKKKKGLYSIKYQSQNQGLKWAEDCP